MRRPWLIALLLLVIAPSAASGQTRAPADVPGAAQYGQVDGLTAAGFSVAPGTVTSGSAVTVSVRITGPGRYVYPRVIVGRAVLKLGRTRVGSTVTRRWTLGAPAGDYAARLKAVGSRGHRLITTPQRPTTLPLHVTAAPAALTIDPAAKGVFPIRGAYDFGGDDARFGAPRTGHSHQGQDVVAAGGTPLVSPVDGTVYWRKVEPQGAGHYLVVRGTNGTDYVFMHLAAGSELVEKGDPVRAGQPIAQVGSTGDSFGPHLHFEIWPDGWAAPGSEPIDPLPQLKAWAAAG